MAIEVRTSFLISFESDAGVVAAHGWTRYAVFHGLDFVGVVFQFRPDAESGYGSRWLAQQPNGVIHGWTTPIRTRKEAGAILAQRAGA